MNLYLISQKVNSAYDTFDAAVVTAISEEEARNIDPYTGKKIDTNDETIFGYLSYWCHPKDVEVTCLGQSSMLEQKVICSSFNAG